MAAEANQGSTQSDPLIGVALGNYKVEAKIAEGGMGIIYRAVHTVIGRKAAIKVLTERYSNDQNMIKRLHREARAVNRIGHPSIVDIFDFGRTPDGRQYFAMEYLEGESLGQMLEQVAGPMDWGLAQQIVGQTLDALAAAHDLGIIHRDIKPENILVAVDSAGKAQVKVLDFGIAKSIGLGPEGEQLTRAGSVMGTPEYIAPEQIRGKNVDGRADLYAVGVILYELLVGKRPFDSGKVMSLLMAHLREDPPPIPPSADVPQEIVDAVARALAKKPEDRFEDARAFARALGLRVGSVTSGEGTRALPDMFWEMDGSQGTADMKSPTLPGTGTHHQLGPAMATAPQTRPATLDMATAEGKGRSPLVWILPTLLMAISAGFITYLFLSKDKPGQGQPKRTATARTSDAATAPTTSQAPKPFPRKKMQDLLHTVRKTLREGILDSNAVVRQRALKGLGDLHDKEVRRRLVKLIRTDPEPLVQSAAALALAELGDPQAKADLQSVRDEVSDTVGVAIDEALMRFNVPAGRQGLLKALKSPKQPTRLAAAFALADATDKAAVPTLEAALRKAEITRLLVPLLTALARLNHANAKKSLTEGLAKKDTLTKLQFAEALAKLGDEKAIAELKAIFDTADNALPLRLRAAKSLASLGDYAGLEIMGKGARAKSPQTRMVAADALGAVDDRSAISPLAFVLQDKDILVRTTAAQSLARIFGLMPTTLLLRSQDWVVAMLERGDWGTRYAAIGASAEMDPEVAVELLAWAFIRAKNPAIRAAIVKRIAGTPAFRTSKKALAVVQSGLRSKSAAVRRESVTALVALGAADAATLDHMIQDSDAAVRIAAAGAKLVTGNKAMFAPLKKVLAAKNPARRLQAVVALGSWDDPQALPLLHRSLKDKATSVRLAAALALAKKGDKSGVKVLKKAIRKGSHRTEEAIQALRKLGVSQAATVKAMARSKSPKARAAAMRTSTDVFPPRGAMAILERGTRDRSPLVRRAAARALGRLAAKEPRAARLLRRLTKDADGSVQAIARLAATKIPGKGGAKVAPLRTAPVPPPAALPARKKGPEPRAGKKAAATAIVNLLEEPKRNTDFNRAFSNASLAARRGRWSRALSLMAKASRLNPRATAPIFETGALYLKLARKNGEKPGGKANAIKDYKRARAFCRTYLKKAPNGKLAGKARNCKKDARDGLRKLRRP